MNKEDLIRLTKEHIHEATHYNVEFLKKVYSDNVMYVMVNEKDEISTMSKDDLINYFTQRQNEGLAPLAETSDFLYANADEKTAICNRKQRDGIQRKAGKNAFYVNLGKNRFGMDYL